MTTPQTHAHPVHRSGPARVGRRWVASWIVVVTAGEAVGFAVPAVVGVAAQDLSWFSVLLLLAGAVEGALLGWAQAFMLSRRIPALRRGAWIALTAAGAVVAYGASSVVTSSADQWLSWPWQGRAVLFTVAGAVILLSIGSTQWVELRRYLPNAGWWVAVTAVAWLIGLALFFIIATPLWYEGQDAASAVLVGVVAGLAMAAAMATVTGLAMDNFLRVAEENGSEQ